MKVVKSKRAKRDLISIHKYIAEDNKSRINADRYMRRMDDHFELIATQPGMGKQRDDLLPGLRAHPLGRYQILYRLHSEGIEIVRVIHGARDLEAIFH